MTNASHLKLIPLNCLVVSPQNVRKTDRKADVAALAASIESHGLLQNLAVTDLGDGKFAVVAGGRRLAALKMLAKTGGIAKDYPVPCQVVALEGGAEASLVENVHRIPMSAVDEVDAFAALAADKQSADDIARRFGVTRRHVEQRLALAGLSPKVKAAWKRGDVSLEAARAFCLVDNHAQQEAVFRSLGKPVTHASVVRARLMDGRMRSSDRLALFVGLDAYEAAGGPAVRDLFEEDAVYIGDPALILSLAEQKLEGRRLELEASGWGWAEVFLGNGRPEGLSAARVQPTWREATVEENAELERLRSELDALDAALEETSTEDDERWETRDDLAAAIETLRQSMRAWDENLMRLAGVVLSVGHDGTVQETAGLVRQKDQKAVHALRRRPEQRLEPQEHTNESVRNDVDALGSLPKALIRDLSRARTRALRNAVASDAHVALALAVAAMASRACLGADLGGVAVAAHPVAMDDHDDVALARSKLEADLPAEPDLMLAWCLAQTVSKLLQLLAVFVSGAIDLTHERGSPGDPRRQALADELSAAVNLDMTRFWNADVDYWARLPKGALLSTLQEAPCCSELSASERESLFKTLAKLKKDDLAARAAAAWEGSSYLPDLLVTPLRRGALFLTSDAITAA